MPRDKLPFQIRHYLPGLAVALLGIGVSVFVAREQTESAVEVDKARFTQAANSLTEALSRRIDAYTEIAFGLRGLFIVNPALDRRDFVDAVTSLDVLRRHPEIMNIAFTRYVLAADKQRFENQVRSDTTVETRGYPDFAIHPSGARDEYFVAHYLWPMEGNTASTGWTSVRSLPTWPRCGTPCAAANR